MDEKQIIEKFFKEIKETKDELQKQIDRLDGQFEICGLCGNKR